jgi:membrane protease YdiL (CAAX protease family)
MQKSSSNVLQSGAPKTWGSLLVLVGFVLIGMVVGNILAMMILASLTHTEADQITAMLNQLFQNPEQVENAWNAQMILQGTVHAFSYSIPCLLFWFYIEGRRGSDFAAPREFSINLWLLTLLLVLVFIPLNSQFIEWNSRMTFPESFSGLEKWMHDKEDQMARLTEFLTKYDQLSQLLIALVVVVILPAFGEELLFRGLIQRKFSEQWRNPHLAIWVSAAIFSAIHFQFYGFIPRMLLGALFGYIYHWTGSLWLAVFAHFINNGFVLIMVYLYNIKVLDINLEETKSMPVPLVAASLVLTALALYLVRNTVSRKNLPAQNTRVFDKNEY